MSASDTVTTRALHRTAHTAEELRQYWSSVHNFLLADECVPFDWKAPPIADVVDRLRQDDESRIRDLTPGRPTDFTARDEAFIREFRAMPIERALEHPFSIAHFNLTHFTGRGDLFFGMWDAVIKPWQTFMARAGFTWYRCYPIVFISGTRVPGRYHMDVSHVVAWQVHGTKVFHGLIEPRKWAPLDQALDPEWRKNITKPEALQPTDLLSYEMPPGTVLWNQVLTPHWVDAGDDGAVAMSLNISHGGLRLNGELSSDGEAQDSRYREHPQERF